MMEEGDHYTEFRVEIKELSEAHEEELESMQTLTDTADLNRRLHQTLHRLEDEENECGFCVENNEEGCGGSKEADWIRCSHGSCVCECQPHSKTCGLCGEGDDECLCMCEGCNEDQDRYYGGPRAEITTNGWGKVRPKRRWRSKRPKKEEV